MPPQDNQSQNQPQADFQQSTYSAPVSSPNDTNPAQQFPLNNKRSRTLGFSSYIVFAIAFIYHFVYTTSKTRVSSENSYSLIMLALATVGGILFLASRYTASHNIASTVTKTTITMVVLIAVWYVSIFVLGFFAI
jgi:membrane-associated HD superfamily phosphohydrolase